MAKASADSGAPPADSARLVSPLLDRGMHRPGGATIMFGDTSAEALAGHLVLDSFMIDSLGAYVRHQARVRAALGRALERHRVEWSVAGLPRGAGVWKRVKVSAVLLEPRSVVSRAQLRSDFPDMGAEAVARVIALSDTERTRSRYTLVLDGPWNDGHQRMAVFRDNRLIEFQIEG